MTRLIDAEILFEKVGNIKPNNKSEYELLGKFMNMITDSPTVDRPHGEWHTTHNPNYSPFDSTSEVIYTCSQCAYSCGDRIVEIWHFCPCCGADMSANDRQVTGKLNSEIEKSKSEIIPDYRDGWRLRGEAE